MTPMTKKYLSWGKMRGKSIFQMRFQTEQWSSFAASTTEFEMPCSPAR